MSLLLSAASIVVAIIAVALQGCDRGSEDALATEAPPRVVNTGASFWHMGYGHTDSEAGISFYTHMWKFWASGKPQNWGVGLPGTWLHGTGLSFTDVCACNPKGWPNNPKAAPGDQANGCCAASRNGCGFLYETIEGGPQDDGRWRLGANVGCFQHLSGSGLFDAGAHQHPCDEIAFVSLSNQMLMQPNGVSFTEDGMLGVGYLRTPMGKTSGSDSRNFWTLVLDAETFSGPLGYFLPEFFNGRDKSAASDGKWPDPEWWANSSRLLDFSSPGIGMNNDQFAMEWNHGYTFQQNSSDGELFYKLPPINIPFKNGEFVLAMAQQTHTDDQLTAPLEDALKAGSLDSAKIMARSERANCRSLANDATFHIAADKAVTIGNMSTSVQDGTCVWKMSGAGSFLQFPHYFDKDLNPVDESKVPHALAQQQFPLDTKVFQRRFNALDNAMPCYNTPGPADPKLYCARSAVNDYWVGYRWYRFVDQPALQRVALTAEQRAFMQSRVQALHGMIGRVSRWLKPGNVPAGSDLAHVDPVALVTPPAGLEKGFVPIVLYEGQEKPSLCDDVTILEV